MSNQIEDDEIEQSGRDTQKTQHGIETVDTDVWTTSTLLSRHSENPARD